MRDRLRATAGAMAATLRNREIARLEAGLLLSIAADWAFLVVVLVAAYKVGGAGAVGIAGLVRMLVAMVAGPLASGMAGRVRTRYVLLGAPIVRSAAIGMAVLVLAAGGPTIVLLGALVVEAAGVAAYRPVELTALPQLARSPSELVAANVVGSTADGVGTFVGPAIGGLALAYAGIVVGCVAALALLVACALAVGPLEVGVPVPEAAQPAPTLAGELLAGARVLRERPEPRALFLSFGAQVVVRGILLVLLVSVAIEQLSLGDPGVGLLNSALGAGGFVGALVALGLVHRARLAGPFVLALILWGVPIAAIALTSSPAIVLVLIGIVGASNAALDVSGMTLLQRVVRHADLAPVFGLLEGEVGAGVALGSVLGPLLIAALGLHTALLVTGAILPVAAVLNWSTLHRADQAAVVPDRQLAVLRRVPMFAALPLTTLELIASRLELLRFGPGSFLTRQGDAGDRFYVLEDGQVEVEVGGRIVRTLGPGDALGEIALLRSIPRTATVRATKETTAWGLDGAVFVAAVSSRADSVAAAQSVIAARLRNQPTRSAADSPTA